MSTPREYIEKIQSEYLASSKRALDALAGTIATLKKSFQRYGSFLMEFVQNADDAESKTLRVEILKNTIRILNNGRPFCEEDVESICNVGRSSKSARDYIGYLGVGFKSVFLISENTEIYSGEFRFKFDKTTWPDPAHTPWQIIPTWIKNPKAEFPNRYTTVFNIRLVDIGLIEKIREELKPEFLNNRLLLFLRNIEEIDLIDTEKKIERKIIKSQLQASPGFEIHEIKEHENNIMKSLSWWVIFRSSSEVPEKVRDDYTTKEWERENVNKREILVAFRIDWQANLMTERKGTAYSGVFSYLPLKEVPSGLNFLIQADFLTTPGRTDFARECLWNKWLACEIHNLIINKCIPTFLQNEQWKMNFTEVLYSLEGGHELFENHIKKPLREYLENNAVSIAEDGSVVNSKDLVEIGDDVRTLLNDEDIKLLFPNKKTIHKSCKLHPSLKIQQTQEKIHKFLYTEEGFKLIEHKAKLKDVEWFKRFYSLFMDENKLPYSQYSYHFGHYNREHDNFWDQMRNFYRPMILTDDYALAKINECYINPKKLKIYEQIKDRFKIVHSELAADKNFEQFIRKLNEIRYYYRKPDTKVIKELTEDDIKNILKENGVIKLNEEKWISLPDDKKIEEIKNIKNLWAKKYFSLGNYSYLTLKSITRKWIKPEELFSSEKYKPDHNLEKIIEKKLYDKPLEFVSADFIQDASDEEIKEWYRFFKELGVDKKLEEKKLVDNIVQRIGILTALKYEEQKGRRARELPRSEETGGYDIEQTHEESEEGIHGHIQSEQRYIEVKGRRKPSPDIFLSANQIKKLSSEREKYFVYVVKDALRYPTLCITRGDKLLDITDIKMIIPFDKWSKEAIDDEFQP